MSASAVKDPAARSGRGFEMMLALVGGIVMFLIGPAIPQLLDQYRDHEDLWYIVEGPVYFGDMAAYSIDVQNRGRQPQQGVELWVPRPPGTMTELDRDPFDFSTRPVPSLRREGDYSVATLGDLQPGDGQRLSVLVSWNAAESDDPADRFRNIPYVIPRVKAGERTAPYQGWRTRAFQAERRAEWYRSSLDLMFAAVVILILLLARAPADAKDEPPPR
jgi:hypothetical protein